MVIAKQSHAVTCKCVCQSLSRVRLFATTWTVARQCPSPWVRALLPSPPRPALTLGAPEHEPKPLTVLLLQQNCLLFDDVIAGGEGGGGARVGWVEKGS